MRIGVDARFYTRAGPGRYVKNILSNLEELDSASTYIVFLTKEGFDAYKPKGKNFKKVVADFPVYSFAEQFLFLYTLLKAKLDALYVPHFNIPILYPKRLITAIPDMIMHKYSTDKGTTLPKPYFIFKKFIYKIVFFIAVARSKKVIVPSNQTLNDFLKYLPFSKDKYVLSLEGVDASLRESSTSFPSLQKEFGINRPYILFVGSMYEHKNVEGLIEMFKILKSKYKFDGQMVLVSKKDNFSKKIFNQVKKLGLEKDIIIPSLLRTSNEVMVITDSEATCLRKNAMLYTIASFMEGFSLTALEAILVGVACVVSDIEIHREIYKDCVEYFNPHDVGDMASKVYELLSNDGRRAELGSKSQELLKMYDFSNTAKDTLAVFKTAWKKD